MITVGSNISSLKALRRLDQSTEQLGRTYERLSSGQRINRASDDAAGLAISEALRSDSRISTVASRNLNDGISAINIASGTLTEQSTLLTRLTELAEQSANGTFSNTQRATLNREYQELVKEFGRIGDSTTFNGTALLRSLRTNGQSGLNIQAGLNGSSSSQLRLTLSDTGSLSGELNWSTLGSSDFDRNGFVDSTDFNDAVSQLSLEDLASRLGNSFISTKAVDSSGKERDVIVALMYDANITTNFEAVSWVKNLSTGLYEISAEGTTRFSNLFNGDPTTLTLNASSGAFDQSSVSVNAGSGITLKLDLSGLRVRHEPTTDPSSESDSAIAFSGVETVDRALAALGVLARRREDLAQYQGLFGAFQSRFESALALTQANREAFEGARSRILDADVAADSAQLVRQQILQQAASSVLAQANAQPQLALQLLR